MSVLKHILLVLACLLFSLGVRAQGITLSGTVTDKSTGAPVSFATVVVDATEQWAVADAKGKFVLRNVSVAASIVRVDCLGYVTWARDMKFSKDIDFRVELSPDNLSLESAIVTAQDGAAVLSVPELLYLPAGAAMRIPLHAEPDAIQPDTEITYSIKDDRGRQILQERRLRPAEVQQGVQPELVFPMPPYPFHGMLTLTCGACTVNCAVSCVR